MPFLPLQSRYSCSLEECRKGWARNFFRRNFAHLDKKLILCFITRGVTVNWSSPDQVARRTLAGAPASADGQLMRVGRTPGNGRGGATRPSAPEHFRTRGSFGGAELAEPPRRSEGCGWH